MQCNAMQFIHGEGWLMDIVFVGLMNEIMENEECEGPDEMK
jgi:hypothetical protein